MDEAPKVTVVPAGFKLADKAIVVVNPLNAAVFKVAVPLEAAQAATVAGLLKEKVAVGDVCILRLLSEKS